MTMRVFPVGPFRTNMARIDRGLKGRPAERVPIARLKASLASYLARLKAGECFVVTDRGTPVGVLEPVTLDADEPLLGLIAQGLVSPPMAKLSDEFFGTKPRVQDPAGFFRRAVRDERGED
jgi:antitoxin (DNA-binding transcriptional repressor) of toxin-antitoxin stability system